MRKVGTSKAPKKLTSVLPKDYRIYEKILIKGFEYVHSSEKGMNNTNLTLFPRKYLKHCSLRKVGTFREKGRKVGTSKAPKKLMALSLKYFGIE